MQYLVGYICYGAKPAQVTPTLKIKLASLHTTLPVYLHTSITLSCFVVTVECDRMALGGREGERVRDSFIIVIHFTE